MNGKKQQHAVVYFVGFLMLVLSAGCGRGRAYQQRGAGLSEAISLSAVRLSLPEEETARKYLGVPGDREEFTLAQIQAEVIIIEIFDMYCGYCQKAAPAVQNLFDLIEQRGYAARIKLIGIGTSNTPFEVETFRQEYELAFPLFPDPRRHIAAQLPHDGIPYFYVLGRDSDGTLSVLHHQRGGFPDAEQFLDAVIAVAGWDENPVPLPRI